MNSGAPSLAPTSPHPSPPRGRLLPHHPRASSMLRGMQVQPRPLPPARPLAAKAPVNGVLGRFLRDLADGGRERAVGCAPLELPGGVCRDGTDAVPSSQPLTLASVCFSFVSIQRAKGTGKGGMELNGLRAGGTGWLGLSGIVRASAPSQAPTTPTAAGGTAEKTPIKLKY